MNAILQVLPAVYLFIGKALHATPAQLGTLTLCRALVQVTTLTRACLIRCQLAYLGTSLGMHTAGGLLGQCRACIDMKKKCHAYECPAIRVSGAGVCMQALSSPISGVLGDKVDRTRIVSFGCFLWGVMTAAIGMSVSLRQVGLMASFEHNVESTRGRLD